MSNNSNNQLPAWVNHFPSLMDVEDVTWVQTANRAKEVVLPKDYEVFSDGDECENYIMVIEGITRVYKSFENGRDMLLYRVNQGETCSLTTSILLAGGKYTASAITETECRAMIIPIHDFHKTFDDCKGFRDFVCATFGGRIRDFILLLESIATRNVDVRMARWMIENKTDTNQVDVSHKALAYELGTAREVVSRHLKEFEQFGWVKLSRSNIELIDLDAMHQLVEGLRA
ncbi:MAG: Crp/Fnr family transcriptional regulator [Gammaproteobacteria bacterium]|nr:MAG: Crp/Fnr family transcriptional regulator [Gammaproteobacteria bacterium]